MYKPILSASAILLTVILTAPAHAHSAALCKFDVFDTCLESGLPHSWCVAAAEQHCAGHGHGGGTVEPAGTGLHQTRARA